LPRLPPGRALPQRVRDKARLAPGRGSQPVPVEADVGGLAARLVAAAEAAGAEATAGPLHPRPAPRT
jgi:hypothetical protein